MKLFVVLLALVSPALGGKLQLNLGEERPEQTALTHKEPLRQCPSSFAADIAQNAAGEARAALSAQGVLGAVAAYQVRKSLAEKAIQAAKAAEAALSGKQALLEEIQSEAKTAEQTVASSAAKVRRQQESVNAAMQSTQQAAAMVL